MAKISIITPSLNQARYLPYTIESVLNQGVDFEYIILDGCSDDGTLEILDLYKDRIKIVVEKDEGQADAIAKGFSIASGDILAWINSDDMYLPHSLEKVLNAFHRGYEFIYGNVFIIDQSNNVLRKRAAIQVDFDDLYYGMYCLPQESTFFSRSLYFNCGGIDKNFHYAMDYDLWLRMASIQRPYYINEYLACFRYHRGQKSRRIDLYNQEVLKARRKSSHDMDHKTASTWISQLKIKFRKIGPNLRESGLKKTICDIANKKLGKLP